jgi:hypothetical protein
MSLILVFNKNSPRAHTESELGVLGVHSGMNDNPKLTPNNPTKSQTAKPQPTSHKTLNPPKHPKHQTPTPPPHPHITVTSPNLGRYQLSPNPKSLHTETSQTAPQSTHPLENNPQIPPNTPKLHIEVQSSPNFNFTLNRQLVPSGTRRGRGR